MDEDNQANTAKIIQLDEYDRTLGTDELNLAEFPLAVLATRTEPGQNTLLFEDTIYDEGARSQVRRSLVIAGSDHFGLPTATDSDILLVLIHLSNVRNSFKSRKVEFSRYELIKFLGWPDDGRSYARLDESLKRWTSVTLHYKHAWWQRSKEKWRSRSFHILETLELRAKDEIYDDGLSTFTWNEVIHDSFRAGNLRRINLNTYFSLNYAASKNMFRFLGKRFYRSARLKFDLREFAVEHIGLGRNYDIYDLKRKLTPAIEELVAIGFLAELSPDERFKKLAPGTWEVTFVKGAKSVSTKTDADSSLVSELLLRGVSAKVARDLCAQFTPQRVSEKISFHDELLAAKDRRVSRNAAGFLASSIRHDFRVTSSRKSDRKNSPPSNSAHSVAQEPELAIAVENEFSVYWDSLAIEEQARLEREALEGAPKFHKLIIARLETSQSALREEMKRKLIREYALREGIWKCAK